MRLEDADDCPDMQGNPLSAGEGALIAHSLLGGGLPPEAEDHLWQAGLSYHLDDIAERHLREAQALAPGHAAVLIGLYRFYFYKGRLAEALEIAKLCLAKAARENDLAANWRGSRRPTPPSAITRTSCRASFCSP